MNNIMEEAEPPQNLRDYISSEEAQWFWATILIAVVTATTVFTVTADSYLPLVYLPLVYLRYVLGLVFILFLPGYTFIKALFPMEVPVKTSSESADAIERIALSFGMSLALVPIVGLLLNYTPWGIRPTPITLSLLASTVAFALAALLRNYQTRKNQFNT
jgi:uncharacterized membrane protein